MYSIFTVQEAQSSIAFVDDVLECDCRDEFLISSNSLRETRCTSLFVLSTEASDDVKRQHVAVTIVQKNRRLAAGLELYNLLANLELRQTCV